MDPVTKARLSWVFFQWGGCVLVDGVITRFVLHRRWNWKWAIGFFGVATTIIVWRGWL